MVHFVLYRRWEILFLLESHEFGSFGLAFLLVNDGICPEYIVRKVIVLVRARHEGCSLLYHFDEAAGFTGRRNLACDRLVRVRIDGMRNIIVDSADVCELLVRSHRFHEAVGSTLNIEHAREILPRAGLHVLAKLHRRVVASFLHLSLLPDLDGREGEIAAHVSQLAGGRGLVRTAVIAAPVSHVSL